MRALPAAWLLVCLGCTFDRPPDRGAPPGLPPTPPPQSSWAPSPRNPLLDIGAQPAGLAASMAREQNPIWNDPSVLAEDGGYSMWASLGKGGPVGVAIYKLRSRDGLAWTVKNGGEPVLRPGDKGRDDFDWLGVETPVVVRVGGTYHMYYSTFSHGEIPLVTMGHATSDDGVRWRKRGELSSVTYTVGHHEGNPWGRLARAEPAAVFHEGRFYLYFTDVRCRRDDCKGEPVPIRGISLAISSDGHDFRQHGSEPVVLQSSSYPPDQGWEGYSTPWVFVHDGVFELFCDVFRRIGGESIQTSLVHLRSRDGIHFEEVEPHVVVAGVQDWSFVSVRSPSVLIDGGVWKMWYAGDNYDPNRKKPARNPLSAGIGFASRR